MLITLKGATGNILHSMNYVSYEETLQKKGGYTYRQSAFINFNVDGIKSIKFSLQNCLCGQSNSKMGFDNVTVKKCEGETFKIGKTVLY